MPEIVYGLFCDDIRQELDGKISFMGVVGDQIKANGPPPLRVRLAFCCMVRDVESTGTPFRLIVEPPGAEPMEIGGRVSADDRAQSIFINWVIDGVALAHAGDLVARLTFDSVPPVERSFRLAVAFAAPAAMTSTVAG